MMTNTLKLELKIANLVLLPLSLLWAMLGYVVLGFTYEAALTRLHSRDSKRVLSEFFLPLCFLALEHALLLLVLVRVFGWRWLRLWEHFRVRFFEPLAS